jgi:hypothetical protein
MPVEIIKLKHNCAPKQLRHSYAHDRVCCEERKSIFGSLKEEGAFGKAGSAPSMEDMEIEIWKLSGTLLKSYFSHHKKVGDIVHIIRHMTKGICLPDVVINTFTIAYRNSRSSKTTHQMRTLAESSTKLLKG